MIYAFQIEIPNGPIKIGCAKDASKRISEFEKHLPWPIKTLGIWPGSYEVEKVIHERFQYYIMQGEWYLPSREIIWTLDHIEIHGTKFMLPMYRWHR